MMPSHIILGHLLHPALVHLIIKLITMVSNSCFSSLLSHLQPHCHYQRSHTRISPSDITSAPREFESALVEELVQKLLPHSEGDCTVNITWICQAMDVTIIAMQAFVKNIVSPSTRPVVTMSDKVTLQYMEDSVKLLDACYLLKETLAGADARVNASQRALKRLQGLKMVHHGEIQIAKHTLQLSAQRVQGYRVRRQHGTTVHRLQACTSLLSKMGNKFPRPSIHHHHHPLVEMASSSVSANDSMPAALYGGLMCALFCLRLLTMALSSPASSISLTTALHRRPGRRPVWGPSLLALQAQLNTQILHIKHKRKPDRRSCADDLLPELHNLDAALNEICQALRLQPSSASHALMSTQQRAATADNLSLLVSSTSALAADVQRSIARLQHQLHCISSSIVDTRMALLDSLTCSQSRSP